MINRNSMTKYLSVIATVLLISCARTSIQPASSSVSRTTTTPTGEVITDKAETRGPGITSDDPKAIELSTVTPTVSIPDGPSIGAGKAKFSGEFNVENSQWILYILGFAFIGAGVFVALKLMMLTLGLTMVGCGAFIIAATFYPILWFGLAASLLAYIGYTTYEAYKSNQDKIALTTVAGAVETMNKPVETPDGIKMLNPVKAKIATAATGVKSAVEAAITRAKKRI